MFESSQNIKKQRLIIKKFENNNCYLKNVINHILTIVLKKNDIRSNFHLVH